jgi:uncharacterized integral membrane protein (TIGR00698 family)
MVVDMRLLPGLGVAVSIGVVAHLLGVAVPVAGAPVTALVLGIATRAGLDRYRHGEGIAAGAGFAARYLLQGSIVLLGLGLSAGSALHAGLASLPVMLVTVLLCLAAAWGLGRLLRVPDPLRTMVGVGTAICGASAIAAVAPVLAATEVETAYAVATIVVYNVTAAVLLPPVGHLLGLGQHAFGLWAGTAVNDTSSVVATAYGYGPAAGRYAIVVKLTRALMILPVVLGLVALGRRRGGRLAKARLFPTFLVLFVLAVLANSVGAVPGRWQPALHLTAGVAIGVALAGVGLGTRLRAVRAVGLRPLALGGLLSLVVALSSLGLQALGAGA